MDKHYPLSQYSECTSTRLYMFNKYIINIIFHLIECIINLQVNWFNYHNFDD